MYNDLMKNIKPGKSRFKHVGVELEIVSKRGRNSLVEAFNKAGIAKYVNIGFDSSIRTEWGEYPFAYEIRCLVPQFRFKDIIKKVCKVLQDTECKANNSCGLHVHLDMRPKIGRDVKQVYTKLVDKLPELTKYVAPRRIGEDAYNPLNRTNDYEYAVKGKPVIIERQARTKVLRKPMVKNGLPVMEKYEIRSDSEGRSAINPHAYAKHKTIEVRLKEGTVDSKDITKWVNKLVSIVEGK